MPTKLKGFSSIDPEMLEAWFAEKIKSYGHAPMAYYLEAVWDMLTGAFGDYHNSLAEFHDREGWN